MSDSKHIMLAIGLFLAVLMLGGTTLVVPNAREVRAINDRIADLQFRSEGVEQTAALVEDLSRMMSDAQRKVNQDLKPIPSEPGIASMIRRLSLTIDGETVVDQTFNVGSVNEPLPEMYPAIRGVPVTMEMTSTFESIYAVLRTVESMDRLVRLRAFRVRAPENQVNGHGEPIIQTTLEIEAVYEEPQ